MPLLNLIRKPYLLIKFAIFYFYELTYSAFRIAWDVVTVKLLSHPGFIEVPLDAKTDLEISIVANLITFSPGTMVVGLSDDKKYMRVHTMFLENEAEAIADIKNNLERRVLEVLR
jgi:multicomponent Na+:H+ antiporter subunit E